MPRNKRKHPISRYERIMLAAINSLPFTFNSPGEPNIPKHYKKMEVGEPRKRERVGKLYQKTMLKYPDATKETKAAPPGKASMN